MKLNLRSSACSLFLHALVAFGVFLHNKTNAPLRITCDEYLTVTVVNMISDSIATQNGSTSDIISQISIPSAEPPSKPIQKNLERPKKSSPLKLAAEKKKIERQTEQTRPLKQKKSAIVSAVIADKQNPQFSNSVSNAELSPAQIIDGPAKTAVVEGSDDSTDQQKHKKLSGLNNQVLASNFTDNLPNRYVQMNYEYIRKAIARNISFPASARKKRLCGKIEVSFLVGTEGSVEDIRIVRSSGHALLDRNVVAAVRRSAPFFASPEKVRIALPIVFRLN